jgi:hypothetical protein
MANLGSTFYDRERTLVNLSNSILKAYGVPTFHPSIPAVDAVLQGHRRIALFLFDGAGESILNVYRRQTRFLREHKLMTIVSVNPATTVACTTSLLTGHYPIETGWLGWSLQMDALGFPVDVFPNRNSQTGLSLDTTPSVMASLCPVTTIGTLLEQAGVKAKLSYQYPVNGETGPKTFKEFVKSATSFFEGGGEFLYSYWTEPDEAIHEFGVHSRHVRSQMRKIAHAVKAFVKKNPDVLLLTIADHGLIDVQYRDLAAFKDLASLLRKPVSIEGRTPTFFVQAGKAAEFASLFAKYFPDWALLTREEVLSKGYFGEGTPNPHSLEFIGDFVAVSLGKDLIANSRDKAKINVMNGHHAGGTPEEREILLAAYNTH